MSYQLPLRAGVIALLAFGIDGTLGAAVGGLWAALAVIEAGMWVSGRFE